MGAAFLGRACNQNKKNVLYAEQKEWITRFFFYKNKIYKNTQADICPKIKNNLRTITRLKF